MRGTALVEVVVIGRGIAGPAVSQLGIVDAVRAITALAEGVRAAGADL